MEIKNSVNYKNGQFDDKLFFLSGVEKLVKNKGKYLTQSLRKYLSFMNFQDGRLNDSSVAKR